MCSWPRAFTVWVVKFTVTSPSESVSGIVAPRRRLGAAEDGAHPGDELVHAEGLGHVVVRPGVEAADLVGLLRARGEHQDGDERVDAPQLLAHGVAVHVREHQIQDDGVGTLAPRQGDAILPLPGRDDPEALELQRVAEPHHDVGSSSITRIVLFPGGMRRT